MIRFQFACDNLADYSVKRMCTVLGLNRSSYYKWKKSAPRRRARLVDDAVMAAEIQAIFDAENGVWGALKAPRPPFLLTLHETGRIIKLEVSMFSLLALLSTLCAGKRKDGDRV